MIKHTETGPVCECGNKSASHFAVYKDPIWGTVKGNIKQYGQIDCLMCTDCKDFIPYSELLENAKKEADEAEM